MTETPEETIARLQRELANARAPVPRSDSTTKPAAPLDARLAPAPRRVPLAFRLVVLPWSWWTFFALFMIAVAPLAVWIFVPIAGAVTVGVTFLAIMALRLRRYRLQTALLKRGEVATVLNAGRVTRGTYYSGTTYQNVRLAQARGWDVERRWYSGPATTTKVDYELNGTRGELKLRGLPYIDGVILADSTDPTRALCVSSFAYDLDRDPDGNWIGKLAPSVAFGAIAMTIVLVAWTLCLISLFIVGAMS